MIYRKQCSGTSSALKNLAQLTRSSIRFSMLSTKSLAAVREIRNNKKETILFFSRFTAFPGDSRRLIGQQKHWDVVISYSNGDGKLESALAQRRPHLQAPHEL